jgi:hypothetical protein
MKYLNILSALFASAAAGLWLMSARVKTPDSFSIHVVRPDRPIGDNLTHGTYMGHAHSQDFIVLADALKRQSRLSACAAICAACAAAMQGVAFIFV